MSAITFLVRSFLCNFFQFRFIDSFTLFLHWRKTQFFLIKRRNSRFLPDYRNLYIAHLQRTYHLFLSVFSIQISFRRWVDDHMNFLKYFFRVVKRRQLQFTFVKFPCFYFYQMGKSLCNLKIIQNCNRKFQHRISTCFA